MREPIATSGAFTLPAVGACAFGTERAGSSASLRLARDALRVAPLEGPLGASRSAVRTHSSRFLAPRPGSVGRSSMRQHAVSRMTVALAGSG